MSWSKLAPASTGFFASVGGVLAAVAPKGLCPICVAASGGVLSSIGLGFLAVDNVIRWVLLLVLIAGLAGIFFAARAHRRFWILGAGIVSAAGLYAGWWFAFTPLLYSGMVVLLVVSLLNFWARRHPRVQLVQIGNRIRLKTAHGQAKGGSHGQAKN